MNDEMIRWFVLFLLSAESLDIMQNDPVSSNILSHRSVSSLHLLSRECVCEVSAVYRFQFFRLRGGDSDIDKGIESKSRGRRPLPARGRGGRGRGRAKAVESSRPEATSTINRMKRAVPGQPARGANLPKRGRRATPLSDRLETANEQSSAIANDLGGRAALSMEAAQAQLQALGALQEEVPDAAELDPDMAIEGLEAVDGQSGVRMAMQGLDKKLRSSGKSDAELAAEQAALFERMRQELERETGAPIGPVRVEDVTEVYRFVRFRGSEGGGLEGENETRAATHQREGRCVCVRAGGGGVRACVRGARTGPLGSQRRGVPTLCGAERPRRAGPDEGRRRPG